MATVYHCDRCGEISDARPLRIPVIGSMKLAPYVNDETIIKDICRGCWPFYAPSATEQEEEQS